MKPATAQALRASVETLLGQAMSLYRQVLEASGPDDLSQLRLQRLFTAASETPRETALVAYEPIVPHVRFGYERDSELAGRLIETKPAQSIGDQDAQNRISVLLDDPGGSPWFAFQLELSWPEVRAAKTLSMNLVGQADEPLKVGAHVRVFPQEGDKIDVASSSFVVERETNVLTADFDLELPHQSFLDFEREPRLLLLFPLRPFRLDIDQLWLSFE